VPVDVVPVTADLTGYDVVVAPLLHMLKGDIADRLAAVVAGGGSVLTTFLSGRVDEDDNAFLMDVPGPLASLFGVRVEETDAQPPEVVNPVHLADPDGVGPEGTISEGRLVFELLVREGAEVVGTYGTDFYAGTPAVTRHRPGGRGEAWYVGTALDDAGVAWVVRQVIDRHGLAGPYADIEDLELAVRERDGVRTGFVLHHGEKPLEVPAWAAGTELLTGRRVTAGEVLHLEPTDVMVLREDPS
jgi:beta-galactosidase